MRRLAMWKTALLNSFGCEELRSGLNLESVAKHFMYIQEGILTNNLPRMPLNELPYTLQKGLEDFWGSHTALTEIYEKIFFYMVDGLLGDDGQLFFSGPAIFSFVYVFHLGAGQPAGKVPGLSSTLEPVNQES